MEIFWNIYQTGFRFGKKRCADLMCDVKQNDDLMIIFGAYLRLSMCWYSETFFMPEMLLAYPGKQMHKQYRTCTEIHSRTLDMKPRKKSATGVQQLKKCIEL